MHDLGGIHRDAAGRDSTGSRRMSMNIEVTGRLRIVVMQADGLYRQPTVLACSKKAHE